MNDTICLSNMVFYGRHGVHEYEQEHGQRFQIDLEMILDLEQAAQTDQLETTLDYTAVYDTLKQIVETEQYRLLEALSGRIVAAVLNYHLVKQVTVRVRKPAVPIPGVLDYVQVSLTRGR